MVIEFQILPDIATFELVNSTFTWRKSSALGNLKREQLHFVGVTNDPLLDIFFSKL